MMIRSALVAALVASLAATAPAAAITGGGPDGNRHPYTGMFVGDWDPERPGSRRAARERSSRRPSSSRRLTASPAVWTARRRSSP